MFSWLGTVSVCFLELRGGPARRPAWSVPGARPFLSISGRVSTCRSTAAWSTPVGLLAEGPRDPAETAIHDEPQDDQRELQYRERGENEIPVNVCHVDHPSGGGDVPTLGHHTEGRPRNLKSAGNETENAERKGRAGDGRGLARVRARLDGRPRTLKHN